MKTHEESGACALLEPWHASAKQRSAAARRKSATRDRNVPWMLGPRITYIDRVIIRNYFQYDSGAPLLKSARRLARSAAVSWDADAASLPPELEARLSALPAGYRRVLVGSDALLVEPVSRAIVDVLKDVRPSAV